MSLTNRLIQSKWSAIAPLLSGLVLMTVLWFIHCRFAAYARPGVTDPAVKLTLDTYSGRLDFMGAMEVQITAIIVAIVVGFGLAVSAIRTLGRSARPIVWIIVFLGALALTILIKDDQSPREYGELLDKTAASQVSHINAIRLGLEGSTALAATVLAIATALVLYPAEGDAIHRLEAAAESYRRLSYLLTAGTILLASDIFTKTILTKWAVAYYVTEPDKGAAVAALGKSIVTGWGVYDSLFLAATYIPSALLVRTRLRKGGEVIDTKAAPAWFNIKWLSDTSLEDIGRAAATLTPFIVGQAANLIGKG
ncbi:MAG: hypothetical protein QOK37_2407 [Thermoanaerobaculia bacterium]|nr:hypothetical protein [Thermoanaerobaculia bacterium]